MNPLRDRQRRQRPHNVDRSKRRGARQGAAGPARRSTGKAEALVIDERTERLIIGRNPVLEALVAGTELRCIWVSGDETRAEASDIAQAARKAGVPLRTASRDQIEETASAPGHQGIVAAASIFQYVTIEAILARAEAQGQPPLLLLLDHIEDPQNFGSLVRTSEAAGVHGVIIPERRAAGVTPAVGKASAGAIEHMPIARVTNLVRTIEQLQQAGLWVLGADMKGERTLFEADLRGPTALVVGSEGRGLSRLVSERCDEQVQIPMYGLTQSLNAAVAGALLLYETVRQRTLGPSS